MNKINPFQLLKWSTFAVFLGRGFQHIYWDAPYRALLWDEEWMTPFVRFFLGLEWDQYATNPAVDSFITSLVDFTGWFYLLCALGVLLLDRFPRLIRPILILGGLNLIFLAGLYCKEKFFFIGQFFEYTLQWSSVFFLLAFHSKKWAKDRLLLWMKVAIALTFTCHGLYAVGYYPRPGHFMQMTMEILHINEASAVLFLNAAGALDFVLSILIFLPRTWALIGLAYAVFWGFSTTIARIWANFIPDFWENSLLQWTHESVMRFPHFLIPLFVFVVLWNALERGRTASS